MFVFSFLLYLFLHALIVMTTHTHAHIPPLYAFTRSYDSETDSVDGRRVRIPYHELMEYIEEGIANNQQP